MNYDLVDSSVSLSFVHCNVRNFSTILEEYGTKLQTHLLVGSTNLGNSACPAKIFS